MHLQNRRNTPAPMAVDMFLFQSYCIVLMRSAFRVTPVEIVNLLHHYPVSIFAECFHKSRNLLHILYPAADFKPAIDIYCKKSFANCFFTKRSEPVRVLGIDTTT